MLPCPSLPHEFPTDLQKPRKTRTTIKKKVVAQEVGNVNDTDSDEDVEVWVTNKPTKIFLKTLTVMMLVSVMMM